MKRIIPFLLLCLCVLNSSAQRTLQQGISQIIKGFHGDVGVYVMNLRTLAWYGFQEDTVFPTASMVKLPIMIALMEKMHRGELSDTQHLEYRDSLLYEGIDILGSFKSGERIELSKVAMLMLSMSDNTASLWLQ